MNQALNKEVIEAINYALNLSPLWRVKKPDINTCNEDELQKYTALEILNEKLLNVQNKFYED